VVPGVYTGNQKGGGGQGRRLLRWNQRLLVLRTLNWVANRPSLKGKKPETGTALAKGESGASGSRGVRVKFSNIYC